MIQDLGLHYEKIDACENDCMLFWKKDANLERCLTCGESRWKPVEGQPNTKSTKIPRKVVRYFPLKPRLQRLFMSSETTIDMIWHYDHCSKDEVLRHPVDSDVWKSFDKSNPGFARDPHNVRLGIAINRINPFGNLSVFHSTWPVIVIVYNLPPWLYIK